MTKNARIYTILTKTSYSCRHNLTTKENNLIKVKTNVFMILLFYSEIGRRKF